MINFLYRKLYTRLLDRALSGWFVGLVHYDDVTPEQSAKAREINRAYYREKMLKSLADAFTRIKSSHPWLNQVGVAFTAFLFAGVLSVLFKGYSDHLILVSVGSAVACVVMLGMTLKGLIASLENILTERGEAEPSGMIAFQIPAYVTQIMIAIGLMVISWITGNIAPVFSGIALLFFGVFMQYSTVISAIGRFEGRGLTIDEVSEYMRVGSDFYGMNTKAKVFYEAMEGGRITISKLRNCQYAESKYSSDDSSGL